MSLRLIALISLGSILIACTEEGCKRQIYKVQEAEYRLVPKSGYNVRFFLKSGDTVVVEAKIVEGDKMDYICLASAIYFSKGIGKPMACGEDIGEVSWRYHIVEAGEYAVYIRNNSNDFKRYYLNTYYVRCE